MIDATGDQASGQSQTDLIASKFGESLEPQEAPPAPVEEPEESEPQEQPEEVAEVEYEGTRYQVPKALEKAILQERDYTRKTQEVAEQRRALEQSQSNLNLVMMENEFHQSVAEDVHNLRNLEKHIEALEGTDYNQMDSDTIVRHLAQIQRAKAYKEQLSGKIEKAHAEFKDKFGKQLQENRSKSHEVLAKDLPGYQPEAFKEAREYGKKLGFPEQVLDSIEADPKAARVLYEAMSYRKLQANKAASVKKLDAPVVKPGQTKPMPQEVKDKLANLKAIRNEPDSSKRSRLIEKNLMERFR